MGDVGESAVTSSASDIVVISCVALSRLDATASFLGRRPSTRERDVMVHGLCRPDVSHPVVTSGAELVSTWPLTTRRSEPRTQVGLVNHPAQSQLAKHPEARRPSRSPWSIRDIATGLSSYNPQDGKASAPAWRRKSVGASHPAGRVVMPLPGRNEVTTALGEDLVGASHGRGFESLRLHLGCGRGQTGCNGLCHFHVAHPMVIPCVRIRNAQTDDARRDAATAPSSPPIG